MPSCPAEGCNFTTTSDRSLAAHVIKCQKAATGLALIAEGVGQHEANQRQAKRRRVLSPEHLEVTQDTERSMDLDVEVRTTNNRS